MLLGSTILAAGEKKGEKEKGKKRRKARKHDGLSATINMRSY
jgi:hypothetical protein